jgi:iron complex outermembrane receptor protein
LQSWLEDTGKAINFTAANITTVSMKKSILAFALTSIVFSCIAQEETDSVKTLNQVTVTAFEQQKPLQSTVAKMVTTTKPELFLSKMSWLSGMNGVAGVRMEERSPGSYRLNIRGSSLRSPFGVRNVKIYWNNIPVTDPGGNSYFNQFAWNSFSTMTIVKGPAGSMYGAGTGGLLLLNSLDYWKPGISLEYITGSYNTHNIFLTGRYGRKEENTGEITYAHNQSDGYRVQTNMRRDNLTWVSKVKRNRYEMTASLLFTDMYYQTPGALTLAEFNANPKAARPAGGGFPSAVDAKAAIFQKNLLAGFSNLFRIAKGFDNTTVVYGAFSQIKNSAIRNYERRNEPSYGGRSSFNYKFVTGEHDQPWFARWQLVAGGEYQQGFFNTQVSKNRNGNPDTLQTNDDVNNLTYNIFLQSEVEFDNGLSIAAGASVTKTKLEFRRLNRYPVTTQSRTYRNEIAPRFTVSKKFEIGRHNSMTWLASASRGFSPPTVAEVLPSTGVISTELEAEEGWNYETKLSGLFFLNKLAVDVTGFYFKMQNALVQRRDLSGADYFVNTGDIIQKGIEAHADYTIYLNSSVARSISLAGDATFNHFRYGDFVKGSDDFSGKKVPSVPSTTWVAKAAVDFAKGFYLSINFFNASKIYLNDANTAVADPYHLLGCQVGWKRRTNFPVNIFAGVDNLLDEKYSLGNDINAAGNRFYNAAPRRNFYVGVAVQWIKKPNP